MLRQARTPVVLLFAMMVVIAGTAHAAAPRPPKAKRAAQKSKTVAAQPAPAAAPVPEPPKTPAQLPPVAPNVTFTNGLLSIDAPNSNLSDVLSAVRRVTGASVEGGGAERVVVHLGPGKPRDVLSAMLQGSRYDFIILGPKNDPGGVQKVMLMARAGGQPAPNAVDSAPVAPGVVPGAAPNAANTNPSDEDEDVGDREPEEVSPKGAMPPELQGEPGPEQPGQQPPPQPQQQQQQQQQPPAGAEDQQQQQQQQGPQIKSPEQLFRELQELQKQQQQQQQQQQPPK
jgi:hypothetical protein